MRVVEEAKPTALGNELEVILTGLTALKRGDTSVRLPLAWTGLPGKVARAFNAVVDNKARMTENRERSSRAVGKEGGIKPRTSPSEGSGSLNGETRLVLAALTALKRGDPSERLPVDWTGLAGKVAETFNDVLDLNARMAEELSRLSRVVGKEGKLRQRASLGDVSGFWRDSIESINSLIDDLVHPTSEVARVIGAVAQGDLSKSMALEVDGRALEGEFLRTSRTINKMVEQLGTFSAEVTRVAREVGTEGKLGGQAKVKGVAGTWKDLTDSVNSMAGNLTD